MRHFIVVNANACSVQYMKGQSNLYLLLQNILLQRDPLINILFKQIYFINFVLWNFALSNLTGFKKLHSAISPEIAKCQGRVAVNVIIKSDEFRYISDEHPGSHVIISFELNIRHFTNSLSQIHCIMLCSIQVSIIQNMIFRFKAVANNLILNEHTQYGKFLIQCRILNTHF